MNKLSFKHLTIILIICLLTFSSKGQSLDNKKVIKYNNWHNADLKKDKKNGVSTDLAYSDLLSHKKSTPIIVAVIDGGVDIYHEDLKEVIWNNPNEIPDNGIDDDKNGFIDDIHGWSFLGVGPKGSLIYDNLEITREYKRLKQKFENQKLDRLSKSDSIEYNYFLKIKEKYTKESLNAETMYNFFVKIKDDWDISTSDIKLHLKKDTITLKDVKALKAESGSAIQYSRDYLLTLMRQGVTSEEINTSYNHFEGLYKYHYNLGYEGRLEVGDNPLNFSDIHYGNKDVKGNRPSHGTFIAGIIAAKRDNNIGINGIADNVKIMSLVVVPDGDERDKDVALAIRYATDNGAKIINMSFGKDYSPNKKEVVEAIEYAAAHNVLLVHAAGNDATSNDTIIKFPSLPQTSVATKSFIVVGASTIYKNKKIPADFSNYGINSVDIFAPGEDIYSTNPENTYEIGSGTSFACPVVSGVAALLWSYYPNLSSKQVKEILMKSGVSFANKQVLLPNPYGLKKLKIDFGKLSISGKIVNAYNALKMAETY